MTLGSILLAALTVVDCGGALSVLRDGRTVVEAIAVDRGPVGSDDVRHSFETTPSGAKVWNAWSEVPDRRFRLEVAERPDGAVELTMAGEVDYLGKLRRRAFSFRVPHGVLDGEGYRSYDRGLRYATERSGVFGAETAAFESRFLAAGGLAFDFNATGPGDYYASEADGWSHMDILHGFCRVERDDAGYRFSACGDVHSVWGGYIGTKIVIREGDFGDYARRHVSNRFHYSEELAAQEVVRFGDPRKGRFYTGESGKGTVTRRFACAADGYYLVTFAAGNPAGADNRFSVSANGETLLDAVTIAPHTARTATKAVHSRDRAIEVTWSGDWLVSFVAVQPLLADGEDFSIARKPWVTDGFEPGTLNRNSDFARPPVFPVADDVYDLPVSGQECVGEPRTYPVRDYRVGKPADWIFNARMARVFNNTSSLEGLDAPELLGRYFENELERPGYNAVMLSGMLSRHTYVGHVEKGLERVRRFTAEAHRRGIRVIDHFDATLLWNLCGGFRVMGERVAELDRCRGTWLPSRQFCIMNPDFRRALFDYARRDVVENGVDGLQIDEVEFWIHGCVCRHCRAAFERDTGWKVPMDETSPHWKDGSAFSRVWKTWRYRQSTNLLGDLRESLRAVRPDLVLSAYVTQYGLHSNWEPLGLGREFFDLPRAVDFFGVEVMTRDVLNAPLDSLVMHRIMSLFSTVHVSPVWNWYYNGDWRNDYAGWALDEMTAQCPLLADVPHPAGTPDYARFTAGMVRAGATTVADVAVVFPNEARLWGQDWRGADDGKVVGELHGLLVALEKRRIAYDVVTEAFLRTPKAAKYRFVVRTASDLEAAYASDVWRVKAPDTVVASLWREASGAWAVHLLNLAGGAAHPFAPVDEDIVLTLPSGTNAVATSPDFPGRRELPVVTDAEGRSMIVIRRGLLSAYLFIRIVP